VTTTSTKAPSAQDPYFEVDERRSRGFDVMWGPARPPLSFLHEINNIPISHRYMVASFAFFLVGGFLALLMRIQLAVPDNDFLDPETYNQLFTMHGTTMMFLFVIPFIEAVSNYMLPLLLGTRDLPFPRFTALAFWTYLWGALFLYSSFLFGAAPDAGWFAYVPLSGAQYSPGLGLDFWDIGLSVAEIAALGAAAEIAISVLRMRAPGQSLARLPIFAWSMLVTAFMIIFAFTALIVATAMLEFDRKGLTRFFVPESGGDPLLWQHLFWVFGHPEVYIMFLPAVGMVSQILPVFARRPLVSYPLVIASFIATGVLSFGLWVHHMFTTGHSQTGMAIFQAVSFLIAIPTGIQVFVWIATLWRGRPVWKTPLLFIAGFIVIFVVGGVTGVMLGAVAFDQQAHDTHFVVAHLHYVLIGGVVFPFYAMLYYWLPKITGRMLLEWLGKINFWMMFVFFNVTFFPMHVTGLLGMPRRVYTFPAGLGWEPYNLVSSIGALGFGLSAALLVVNVLLSLKWGKKAGANPWGADTLEWWETSPPPAAQFKHIPFVTSRHPLWDQQSLAPESDEDRELIEPLRSAPTDWRGALIVSVRDARPLAITHMPARSIWPFAMSIGFLLMFAAALIESLWMGVTGGVVTAVCLVGWHWPDKRHEQAIAEIGLDREAGKLPLAVLGPVSNGWWGMLVFLLVMAVALLSLLASYWYLGAGATDWPPALPSLGRSSAAALAALAVAALSFVLGRGARRDQLGARRLGIAAVLLVSALLAWLTTGAWSEVGIRPSESAYASAFISLMAFHWLMVVVLVALLAAAGAWAWIRPADPRGRAVALISELQGYFLSASWTLTYAALYVAPRIG
jgi:cytochrome c oxidase subunit I+III